MADWGQVQRLLDQAAGHNLATHLVLLARHQGQTAACLCAGQARPETVFDLASLTKPLATAFLFGRLFEQGPLTRSTTLEQLWGQAVPTDKQGITLGQLLCHAAGYPAHRPYDSALKNQPPHMRRPLLKAMLMNEPLTQAPGSAALYSDLGYMLLGLVLENLLGQGQDQLLVAAYGELGVDGPRYLPVGQEPPWPQEAIAPCGGPAWGLVQDDNAAALMGVAGHAGLFGSAAQTAAGLEALLALPQAPALCARDQSTPGSTRTPAFDTPSGPQSAAGANPPAGTVGHTGYTGASAWCHPPTGRGLILLTNHVACGYQKEKIRAFRHQVHSAAWELWGEE